ncbi:MAG: hypothetical protein ABW139_13975 [Candidatus Thiodiazotropha sp. DIVDIV]
MFVVINPTPLEITYSRHRQTCSVSRRYFKTSLALGAGWGFTAFLIQEDMNNILTHTGVEQPNRFLIEGLAIDNLNSETSSQRFITDT